MKKFIITEAQINELFHVIISATHPGATFNDINNVLSELKKLEEAVEAES